MTLRRGFTTGTAAAAAAKAATLRLLDGKSAEQVNVPLPVGGRLDIAIREIEPKGDGFMAAVIKDAGDDPDVTHHAVIRAWVRPEPASLDIALRGGPGVGRVTKPGLPVPVGEAAINPTPRTQIRQAIREAMGDRSLGLTVEIAVDHGEELARKTFNPRLGIVGGISILGTRGTVLPFSHEAYEATIRQCLDVMHATAITCPCLTTGGRSERFLRCLYPRTPLAAYVQVADFFDFSMREVGRRHFSEVLWGVFFGKLLKQAQGAPYTHARKATLNLEQLAVWCAQVGIDDAIRDRVATANTALHALEILDGQQQLPALFALLTDKARQWARVFARRPLTVDYLLFDFSGRPLFSTREAA